MSQPSTESKHDSLFTMAAAGLLVLIILLLGVLWYRERQARMAAQQRVQAMPMMPAIGAPGGQAAPINEILAEMLQKQAGAVQPFARADLVRTQEFLVQGQILQALVISAPAGQRLGFAPGDVVIVEKVPTTAPATAPSTQVEKP